MEGVQGKLLRTSGREDDEDYVDEEEEGAGPLGLFSRVKKGAYKAYFLPPEDKHGTELWRDEQREELIQLFEVRPCYSSPGPRSSLARRRMEEKSSNACTTPSLSSSPREPGQRTGLNSSSVPSDMVRLPLLLLPPTSLTPKAGSIAVNPCWISESVEAAELPQVDGKKRKPLAPEDYRIRLPPPPKKSREPFTEEDEEMLCKYWKKYTSARKTQLSLWSKLEDKVRFVSAALRRATEADWMRRGRNRGIRRSRRRITGATWKQRRGGSSWLQRRRRSARRRSGRRRRGRERRTIRTARQTGTARRRSTRTFRMRKNDLLFARRRSRPSGGRRLMRRRTTRTRTKLVRRRRRNVVVARAANPSQRNRLPRCVPSRSPPLPPPTPLLPEPSRRPLCPPRDQALSRPSESSRHLLLRRPQAQALRPNLCHLRAPRGGSDGGGPNGAREALHARVGRGAVGGEFGGHEGGQAAELLRRPVRGRSIWRCGRRSTRARRWSPRDGREEGLYSWWRLMLSFQSVLR